MHRVNLVTIAGDWGGDEENGCEVGNQPGDK